MVHPEKAPFEPLRLLDDIPILGLDFRAIVGGLRHAAFPLGGPPAPSALSRQRASINGRSLSAIACRAAQPAGTSTPGTAASGSCRGDRGGGAATTTAGWIGIPSKEVSACLCRLRRGLRLFRGLEDCRGQSPHRRARSSPSRATRDRILSAKAVRLEGNSSLDFGGSCSIVMAYCIASRTWF